MGKRKRDLESDLMGPANLESQKPFNTLASVPDSLMKTNSSSTIQIILGTYDRVLHGISARVFGSKEDHKGAAEAVSFSDTFLFNAHQSAIRCLALSPPSKSKDASQAQKMILASGGTDERINLYHVSAFAPSVHSGPGPPLPSLNGTKVHENPKNRELGSLLHHSSSINALYFPTRSKLLSAAEDSTIAVSRTRDWTVLSTIKAPIPKAVGRPSGDTAPLGGGPAGINDFAVHPSMKLMISVGKGEKCMRLWNLVTGRKAGVLNFEREILQGVGEGKWGSGEGRKVAWNTVGDEYAVAFERGVVVFGMDSRPKCRIMPLPSTKIHQMRYVPCKTSDSTGTDLLTISTEDGRLLFYSAVRLESHKEDGEAEKRTTSSISDCVLLAQLGGRSSGVASRIKDFEILRLSAEKERPSKTVAITGCSDGSVRIWLLDETGLLNKLVYADRDPELEDTTNGHGNGTSGILGSDIQQIGKLIGTYETGHRITCLKAFVLLQPANSREATAKDGLEEDFEGFGGSDGPGDDNGDSE